MSDFDSIVLEPGDFLILRPRVEPTPEQVETWQAQIPEALRGRVLIVDPGGFDVVRVHPLAAS